MKVRFTLHAKDCLKRIYEYHKEKGKGKYGRTFRSNIIRKSLKLKDFPTLGRVEDNLDKLGKDHRFLIEGDYKIIYRVEGLDVFITDIFDTRQDPDKMLPR